MARASHEFTLLQVRKTVGQNQLGEVRRSMIKRSGNPGEMRTVGQLKVLEFKAGCHGTAQGQNLWGLRAPR